MLPHIVVSPIYIFHFFVNLKLQVSSHFSIEPCTVMEGCSVLKLSRLVVKPAMWFPIRSDTNWPIQAQKRARSLKFQIYVEEELFYPSR